MKMFKRTNVHMCGYLQYNSPLECANQYFKTLQNQRKVNNIISIILYWVCIEQLKRI